MGRGAGIHYVSFQVTLCSAPTPTPPPPSQTGETSVKETGTKVSKDNEVVPWFVGSELEQARQRPEGSTRQQLRSAGAGSGAKG